MENKEQRLVESIKVKTLETEEDACRARDQVKAKTNVVGGLGGIVTK